MCGRFTISVTNDELKDYLKSYFDLDLNDSYFDLPRYNVSPGQDVIALIHDGNKYRIGLLKWGYQTQDKQQMINAKAENIQSTFTFKNAFKSRRCLILADGFYEWKLADQKKIPMRIIKKDKSLFPMAGLYQQVLDQEGHKIFQTVIMTIQANALIKPIHNRMPVIIDESQALNWLHPKYNHDQRLLHMLRSYDDSLMEAYQVSTRVNQTRFDDPSCIEKNEGR